MLQLSGASFPHLSVCNAHTSIQLVAEQQPPRTIWIWTQIARQAHLKRSKGKSGCWWLIGNSAGVCFKCQIRINRNAIVYWIYSAIVNCNLLITDSPIKRDEICLGDHSQGVCTEEKTTNSDPERVFNTLGGVLISRQTSSHKKRKLDLFVKYWENAIFIRPIDSTCAIIFWVLLLLLLLLLANHRRHVDIILWIYSIGTPQPPPSSAIESKESTSQPLRTDGDPSRMIVYWSADR